VSERKETEMAAEELTDRDWVGLVRTVFAPGPDDAVLCLLGDVPDEAAPDNDAWRDRRRLVAEWLGTLRSVREELGLAEIDAVFYRNVGSNNADLPEIGYRFEGDASEASALDSGSLERAGAAVVLEDLLARSDLLLAVTEFSATAPMKIRARHHGYRAATMPGFSRGMISALRVDFDEVARRLGRLREKLDAAEAAEARFSVEGGATHEVVFDLRHRKATVSSGLLRERGMAGNLPSGETYIVPYEGEKGEASRTEGVLPVQLGDEVVAYRIEGNRAREILGESPAAERERALLDAEPAYGNVAELGFGILRDLGVRPVGSILLDEKLGFHVAFGRSDHFGGAVGAKDFRDPARVVHIDRIYIPECQDRVRVTRVRLRFPGNRTETLLEDGRYTIFA
jgi:hypothetical protein